MKVNTILTICFILLFNTLRAQDYDRSSLSIFFVHYSNELPFSPNDYEQSYFPDKFDKNEIGFNTIDIDGSFPGSVSQTEIEKQIYNARIPNNILKNILVDDNLQYMTTKKIIERAEYNAKDRDVIIAKNSARGMSYIQDQGNKLLNKVFFLVITPKQIDETYDKVSTGTIYKYSYTATLYKIDMDYNTIFKYFWFDTPNQEKMDFFMNYKFPIKIVSSNDYTVANTNMGGLTKVNKLLRMINGSIQIDNSKTNNLDRLANNSRTNKTGNQNLTSNNTTNSLTNPNNSTNSRKTKPTKTISGTKPSNTSTTYNSTNVSKPAPPVTDEQKSKERTKELESNIAMGGAAIGVAVIASGMNDSYSGKSTFGKFNLGLGWEQIPMIAVDQNNKNSTEVTSHPVIIAGFKFGFFNNRGISFQLAPIGSAGLTVLDPGSSGSYFSYGGDATLLIGRRSDSHFKLFGEYGYLQRSGSWTFLQSVVDDAAGIGSDSDPNYYNTKNASYNYSLIKYGFGLMYQHINDDDQQTYFKPGVFFENTSFSSSPTMVYNLEMLFSSFIIVDLSYSPNYPVGGIPADSNVKYTPDSKDFFSIKLIKTGKMW